jgi:hypothetical protein
MMNFLAEFIEACREWAVRSGFPERYVVGPLMVFSGAFGRYEKLTTPQIDINSICSAEDLQEWFEHLISESGMMDIFLVFAAIKATDALLVTSVESYAGEKQHFREMQQEFWEMAQKDDLNDEEIYTLIRAIEGLNSNTVASVQELKQRRDALLLWRELTDPIVAQSRFRNG